MRYLLIGAAVSFCLAAGWVIIQQDASAQQPVVEQTTNTTQAEPMAKKCSFDSDCSHGKCKSSKCGGCDFNSDCKGWGVCKSNQCGGCNFDSECKDFGKCSSGKCTKSPY